MIFCYNDLMVHRLSDYREDEPNEVHVLEQSVEDSGAALTFSIKTDRTCTMQDLAMLWTTPDALIRSSLCNKGWISDEGQTTVHFRMDVKERKNSDGTQDWIFRYYLPAERQ